MSCGTRTGQVTDAPFLNRLFADTCGVVVYDPWSMDRRRVAICVLSLALAGWLFLAGVVDGLDTGLLFLAPAFLMLAPLVAGRYVGERRIAKWAASRPVRQMRPLSIVRPTGEWDAVLGSAGLLLARRLAGRAPPQVVPVAA
jgi:hypothetical protein